MDELGTAIKLLLEEGKKYAKTNIELYKLKAIDKSTSILSAFVARAIVVFIFALFILLLNIGFAFYLGELLQHTSFGFLILAGFYALLGVLLHLFRDRLLMKPLKNFHIRQILEAWHYEKKN